MAPSKIILFVVLAVLQLATTTANHWTNVKAVKANVKISSPRIIGGDVVKPNSLPHQVGLRINGNAFCGGALISNNYVITAAHCGEVIRRVDVILGAHNITNPQESTQILIAGKKVILHEKYDTEYYLNDIALIELTQAVEFNDNIKPIQLPSKSESSDSYANQIVTASGWGLAYDVPFPNIGDMSPVLRSVDVIITNVTECAQYYNDDEDTFVTDHNVCTSGYRNKGTCNGDSGGPLLLDGKLIGLTSFGSDECEWCLPSVYTRVVDYLDWIARNSDVTTV